jgi:hypothetical protein
VPPAGRRQKGDAVRIDYGLIGAAVEIAKAGWKDTA